MNTGAAVLVLGTAGMAWLDGGLSALVVGGAIAWVGGKAVQRKIETLDSSVLADNKAAIQAHLRDSKLTAEERATCERELSALEEGMAVPGSGSASKTAGMLMAMGSLVNPLAGAIAVGIIIFRRK